MNNVIQFGTSVENLLEMRLKEFNEYKIKDFSGTLTPEDQIRYDKVYNWLKIHNR